MSAFSSSNDSSSDDSVFTRRVEFQGRQRGASSSSSGVPTSESPAPRDEVTIISERVPPCTENAVEAPAAAEGIIRHRRTPLSDVAAMMLSERVTTEASLQSASMWSEDKSSLRVSPVHQRQRRCVAETRPPAIQGSLGSPTEPATELTEQRGRQSSVFVSGSPLKFLPPSRPSSRQRRPSIHSMSAGDLVSATVVRTSSNTLSTLISKRASGRDGNGRRRRYPRDTLTTSRRALSPVLASPTVSAVSPRLLSDEAYLDTFHIPALIAQLALSLMAAKPVDPRVFTRDWLADRLVSEEDEDDAGVDGAGVSMNSGSGIPAQESEVPPRDAVILTRSTELHSSTSLVLQASSSTMGDLASESGAARLCSAGVSCRQGRGERHAHQRHLTNTSGDDETNNSAKADLAAASDGDEDKMGTAVHRHAAVRHVKRQRKARKSATAPMILQQRSVRGISNGTGSRRKELCASSRRNTSEDGSCHSPRGGSLLATLAPPPAEVDEDRESLMAHGGSGSPMQRSEGTDRNATAAAPSSLPPTPNDSSLSSRSSSSFFTAFNTSGTDSVEWARVELESRRATAAEPLASAGVGTLSSPHSTTAERESSTETEKLSVPRANTHNEHRGRQSLHGSRTTETAVAGAPDWVSEEHKGIHNNSSSSSDGKSFFTGPPQRRITVVPSPVITSTVASGSGLLCANAEVNPSPTELSAADSSAIHPEASVVKRDVAKEGFGRSSGAEEGGEAERPGNNAVAGEAETGNSVARGSETDAAAVAAEGDEKGGDGAVGFAMFVPILSIDATTNEVIDYREAAVSPLSAPAFSPLAGGTSVSPSYPTTSSNGVGGGHLTQSHTPTAITSSSGFPPYATRPVSSTFNVLPTPVLAELVGGGLTNTSFGRRGVPNSSFGRRSAPMTGAAGRYVDPSTSNMAGSSSPTVPLTSYTSKDLSARGVGGSVVSCGSMENLQSAGLPKLNSNLAAGSVGSVTAAQTSGSAFVAGGTTSVQERKEVQDDEVTDAITAAPSAFCESAVLHGGADGARNTALSHAKETLGPGAAPSIASSPLSSAMKLESARRLGKLLDQLPTGKYAAAIVFLEGLLSSSGGSSDAAATPESESINIIPTISDVSNLNRGLPSITNTTTGTMLGGVGLSGEGSPPPVGPIAPGRLWPGAFGPDRSPTGRAPSFAHLVMGVSSQAPALAANNRNEDSVGAACMVSRAPEGDHSRSLSKGGNTSVEALVRDALSQSVLRSLPTTHEEIPGGVPSLPLHLEVSGPGPNDGTSVGMHCMSSSIGQESLHGERYANAATSLTHANTSRVSSPVPAAPGGGSGDFISEHSPSKSESSNIPFYKHPSRNEIPSVHCGSSSSPPHGGDAHTTAALQKQQQQQSVASHGTEDCRSSAATAILAESISGPPSSSGGNSSLTMRGISVSRQELTNVASPTQPGTRCVTDSHEAIAPEHSTTHTAAAVGVREVDGGSEDHKDTAPGEAENCVLGSHAAQPKCRKQELLHDHGLVFSDQSLAANSKYQNTITQLSAVGADGEALELSTSSPPTPLKGGQRRRGNGDESTLHLQYGVQHFMALDTVNNPMSLHTPSVESVSSLPWKPTAASLRLEEPPLPSGTASVTNLGADGGDFPRSGNTPGFRQETSNNSQVSDSASPETIQERPRRAQELCGNAVESLSVSAGGNSEEVGWGGTMSNSPSPPLHVQYPDSAGSELELENGDLGTTLRMAVALAAAAGTRSSPKVHGNDPKNKGNTVEPGSMSVTSDPCAGVAVVSWGSVVTAEPFAGEDANEGLSSLTTANEAYANDGLVTHSSQSSPILQSNYKVPHHRMVEGSGAGGDHVSLSSSQTVSLLNTCDGDDATAATSTPALARVGVSADGTCLATPATTPMVTSSVVVAMNSFFSREDHVAPEELEVVREVVGHYDAFASLDETQLETLVRTMTRMELQRGATVVREGDNTLDQLLFIVSGKLAIARRGVVTRTLARGQFYGEMEMSYHVEHSRVTLTAATPTLVLYALKKADYGKIVVHQKDARRYMFLQYVNECVLFKGLSPYIKMRLADSFRVCRLRKGAKLTEQGAPVEWMYLLMSGNVRMTYQAPSSPGGETSDRPFPRRCPAPEEDARHTVTTSHSFSNFAGSTTLSEAHMSSSASAAAASTVAGTSATRYGTVPSGIAGSLSSSLMPVAVASQMLSSTLLSQAAVASMHTDHQQQNLAAERSAFSSESLEGSSLIRMVSPLPSANAATPQLPSAKVACTTNCCWSSDHLLVQGADSAPPRLYSPKPRSRRLQSQQDRGVGCWQSTSQPNAWTASSLDTAGTKPPSPLSTSASLRQSSNAWPGTTIQNNAASTLTTSLPNTAAALVGTADVSSNNATVVVVDRSKGQLVGETEFVFKCKGLFLAVATTPVQAARISRLHFEAIMSRAVVEEMKRSMLLNPDYYFFEFTVPEELKEDMRRMLLRLNVGPAARRHTRHAHQQHLRHSVTGLEGMVARSRSRSGTAGGNKDSGAGRRHFRNSLLLSRHIQREHNRASFMSNIAGGPGGSSNGPNMTTCSSGSNSHRASSPLATVCVQDGARERSDSNTSQVGSKRHHTGHCRFRTAPLEINPTMARLSTRRTTADSTDAAGMKLSTFHYLAAPTVCGGPFASPALASSVVIPSTNSGEDSVPFTPAPAATMGNLSCMKGRGSSSDDHNRYSRATARPTTTGRHTNFTKHTATTTATTTTTSRRRRVSTRGEIVFSGSRNLYRFTAEAMSMNESIVIAVVVDGTIIRWNSVAQSVTGYAPFEAIGKSIFDFIVSEEGRQHMRDTLAVAARFAGKWEQYRLQRLQEQRVFPFRQNTGLYQVGLALSVIPSNYAKTAEVLLLMGREGKYRAASTYAADVAKWLEESLKPQLRQFQRRMVQIESNGWQLTVEDALQVRGNLDACVSMVEQFAKFSLLNMDVVSQSWRPVRVPALLRRFAVEAMTFARQQQHEYYCNIDMVEPKAEVFLDFPQVLAILRLLLGDALQCPNVDEDGNAIVIHAELRVTVVEPTRTRCH
ncbi:protein kinase, putative [Leishmania tarentolae]|uniref:Protein kinase, putative n=1 Tax=Leishmania tarentolae TaxID=5689 RepID=A0A640KEK3_LEITA|nr:protein kinase, putative [Leishmania tarentolae]